MSNPINGLNRGLWLPNGRKMGSGAVQQAPEKKPAVQQQPSKPRVRIGVRQKSPSK